MAKKWSEVSASPNFQALAPAEQEQARQQYFADVITPQLDPANIDEARTQFDDDTGPAGGAVGNTDVAPVTSVASSNAPAEPGLLSRAFEGVKNFMSNRPEVGLGETLLQGATGTAARAISGVKGLLNPSTADTAATENKYTYKPTSQAAQGIQSGMGTATQAIANVPGVAQTESAINSVSPEILPAVNKTIEAAGDIANIVGVGAPLNAAVKAAKATQEVGGAARAGYGVEGARAAGYELRPSDVAVTKGGKKTPGMRREGLEGSENLQREKTIKNQALTTKLAAEDIGIKSKADITPEALEKARGPHNTEYDTTAKMVGAYKTPEDLQATLDDLMQNGELPKKQRDAVAALKTNVDGQTALDTTRYLRSKARAFMGSDDAKTQAIGENLREASDAIENSISARLQAIGETDQFEKFQSARTSLAKINDYQAALKGGQIDAHALMRMNMKDRGRMTGNAKTIAEAAEAVPNVTGHSSKATGTGSFATVPKGKTGLIERGVEAAARGLGTITRTSVGTKGFQNKFGREMNEVERSYAPTNGKRQTFAPAREAAPPQLGTETLEFSPTNEVAPVGTVRGGLGMELMPDPVPNAQMLPEVPSQLTADVPAPVRYPGGIDFQASGPSLADTLAGELGLAPSVGQGERFAPIVGRDMSGVPHGDMIDFVTDGMSLAPPTLAEQLELPGATLPVPPRMSLVMGSPPGRVGKPKVDKKAGTKGGKG